MNAKFKIAMFIMAVGLSMQLLGVGIGYYETMMNLETCKVELDFARGGNDGS